MKIPRKKMESHYACPGMHMSVPKVTSCEPVQEWAMPARFKRQKQSAKGAKSAKESNSVLFALLRVHSRPSRTIGPFQFPGRARRAPTIALLRMALPKDFALQHFGPGMRTDTRICACGANRSLTQRACRLCGFELSRESLATITPHACRSPIQIATQLAVAKTLAGLARAWCYLASGASAALDPDGFGWRIRAPARSLADGAQAHCRTQHRLVLSTT